MLCMQSLPTYQNVQSNACCCSTTHEYSTQRMFAQNLIACCSDPCIWARYFTNTMTVMSCSVQSKSHCLLWPERMHAVPYAYTHSHTHGSCTILMVAATRLNTQSCSSVSDIPYFLQHLRCWAMCGIKAIQARPRMCGPVEWCCLPCCSAGTPSKLGGGTPPTFRSSSKLARSCSLTAFRQEM